MRVLQLLVTTGWGGAERMASTVHRLAASHGHESRVDAPPLPEVVRALPFEIDASLADPPDGSLAAWVRRARRRRKAFAPDVIHAHLSTPALLGAAWFIAGRRTPLVVTYHLLPESDDWGIDHLLRVRTLRVHSGFRLLHRRHVLTAVSETDRARLREEFAGEDIALTPNAPPLPPARASSSLRLEYPTGAVRLLSVGRLHEQKGFDRMIRALAKTPLRELAWHWTIVGDGPAGGDLERLARASDLAERITWMGAAPSHGLFEQAELVLSPSRYEGMPLVPMEAVLAGTAVIASAISPHRELFSGAEGSLLSDSEDRWADRLAPLLGDGAARAELGARQRAALPSDPRARLWESVRGAYERALRS